MMTFPRHFFRSIDRSIDRSRETQSRRVYLPLSECQEDDEDEDDEDEDEDEDEEDAFSLLQARARGGYAQVFVLLRQAPTTLRCAWRSQAFYGRAAVSAMFSTSVPAPDCSPCF